MRPSKLANLLRSEGVQLPPEEQADLLRKVIADVYKSSLYLTTKYLLGYKDVNLTTHGGVISALESSNKRKLICVPRGTFKSTIGCISYPIWRLMNDPDLRILLDSELYSNSKNFLREIRAQLQRDEMVELFGEWRDDSNWTEGEITIKQRKKISKESSITASGVGAVKVGQHYDLIIGDDYNSDQNSSTQEGREKIIRHYKLNYSILEPTGAMVIIGTRYADNDLIGHILKNEVYSDHGKGLL